MVKQTEDDLFDIEPIQEMGSKQQIITTSLFSHYPIPKYLLNENKEFNEMILTLRHKTSTSISTEELRDMAIFIYQLECIELDKLLWTTYLRSGQGTLIENKEPSLLVWSMELKMMAEGFTNATYPNAICYDECSKYIEKILGKYRIQTNEYQNPFEEKKQQLGNRWTTNIQEILTKFVQQYDMILLFIGYLLTEILTVSNMISLIVYINLNFLMQVPIYIKHKSSNILLRRNLIKRNQN